MSLAIFDLDNTLLNGDSDHAWGEFLCEHNIVDVHTYQQANDYFYERYQAGSLDISEFLSFALKPLKENEPDVLFALREQFLHQKVAPMITESARACLQQHREQGDYLLIITATNRFVTEPIADMLGVDEILATDPEVINGRYTGNITGIPCFQEGKVKRLHQWLKDKPYSLEGSYFYSDSRNDLPLLEQVSHPVAVDADPTLAAIAAERGWRHISLR